MNHEDFNVIKMLKEFATTLFLQACKNVSKLLSLLFIYFFE